MIDPLRGTGRTTKQMLAAPQGAVFISCHAGAVPYDRALAHERGRADLNVVAPEWITSRRWVGLELSGIVIDHDARLSPAECEHLKMALTRVRKPTK